MKGLYVAGAAAATVLTGGGVLWALIHQVNKLTKLVNTNDEKAMRQIASLRQDMPRSTAQQFSASQPPRWPAASSGGTPTSPPPRRRPPSEEILPAA